MTLSETRCWLIPKGVYDLQEITAQSPTFIINDVSKFGNRMMGTWKDAMTKDLILHCQDQAGKCIQSLYYLNGFGKFYLHHLDCSKRTLSFDKNEVTGAQKLGRFSAHAIFNTIDGVAAIVSTIRKLKR